jgi:Fe-S cluster biogenesis protein NfuA
MSKLEKQVHEVLHNLNWLIEPHDSFVELIEVTDKRVIIRSIGYCTNCKTDCIGTAFKERMPDIELIIK